MEHLIKCKIFELGYTASTIEKAVWQKEVPMSREVLKMGWNIGSLLPVYDKVDFTQRQLQQYNIPILGDLMYPRYRNKYWSEYDLVFIKGNRCLF